MGLMLAEPGCETRCYVEWDAYPRECIIAAQRAGYFAPAPIWDDVTTFDGRPFRGAFDTILAGYPCQPFSAAGQRKGADDERHLWPDVARIIDEVRPEWVFLENVAGHLSLGLDAVLRELRGLGFTPAAGLFSAGEVGATHERQRVFIVAHRGADADAGRLDGGGIGRGAREGEGEGRHRERFRAGVGGGREHVAHADGGHAGAAREQRGGELGFQPEGGGIGGEPLADPRLGQLPQQGRRPEGRNGPRPAGAEPLEYPPRQRRGEGRPEPVVRSGRSSAGLTDGVVGQSGGTGCEGGEQRASCRDGAGIGAHGSAGEPGPAWISPPTPEDAAAWAEVLRSRPDLAPAASLDDCVAFARRVAEIEEGPEQAEAQSRIRRLAHGLAARSRALRLLGNGVHPLAAAYAWRSLSIAHGLRPVDLERAEDGQDDAA